MKNTRRYTFTWETKYIILFVLIFLCAQGNDKPCNNNRKCPNSNDKPCNNNRKCPNCNDKPCNNNRKCPNSNEAVRGVGSDTFANKQNTFCKDNKESQKFLRKCLNKAFRFGALELANITQIYPQLRVHARKSCISQFRGIKLSANSSWIGEETTDVQNVEVELVLPSELSKKAEEQHNDLSSITFAIFDNTTLFEDENNSSLLNGRVFGVIVGNTSIQNLTEYMTLRIIHNKEMLDKSINRCVFWFENEDDNMTDHWDSTGCKTTIQPNQTICQCDHLSYFAVLLDFRNENSTLDTDVGSSLMYLTQIGCGISAIFLAVTVIFYCVYRKIKCEQVTMIHMNLCTALFLLNMSFLTNVWLSKLRNDSLCKTIAVFLHYSLLCTLTWMGIEAFQLYLMLIKVFNTYIRYYLQKLAVIGWGIPALVVFVCIGVNKNNYGLFVIETRDKNSSLSMCWITNNMVHYVTNIGYFVIICFGNTAMLITICIKIIYMHRRSNYEKGSVWKDLWTVLGLCCFLGTTWALAFFSFGPMRLTQIYLFTILNSLHGFLMFLWYYALKRPTKDNTSTNTSTT
ncbi:adhesion G-protein coupled receptor G5-like isoform X2 [Heterodontus francisci]|uniref:adhesion G-protein coupled receptor G5-like isoform X2 n=1 Tax=Heterodontus francisci TaxID=7792 RepID=UPI00355BBBDC